MERKPPRLYIALRPNLRIRQLPLKTICIYDKDDTKFPVWTMCAKNFPYLSALSLELPTGYGFCRQKRKGGADVLCFRNQDLKWIYIREDLIHGIFDLPNDEWIWTRTRPQSP